MKQNTSYTLRFLNRIQKVSVNWRWYDVWVGVFIDKRHNPLVTKYYVCPFPCLLITIEVRK